MTDNISYFAVEKSGRYYQLIDTNGNVTSLTGISSAMKRQAFESNRPIKRVQSGTDNSVQFHLANTGDYKINKTLPLTSNEAEVVQDTAETIGMQHSDITDFIHSKSVTFKPKSLIISDLKWKYLIRSVLRGKNIMMTGPSGTGKTFAVQSVIKSLDRPYFYFNLGSTQDARAAIIGNTHFDKERGTFFSQSAFVTAIKTPNAIILLDELSRAHPEAWNILMTVLDQGQRYLRLDEADGSPVIEVADGVSFIATANIGNEYTSTRVMDRAILDRFVTIEMDVLNESQEFDLLKYMYPHIDDSLLLSVSSIAHATRTAYYSSDAKLSTFVSTRSSVEMAGLIYDGFTLEEAAQISIYPFFSNDGGIDSERTYVRQVVQKFIVSDDGTNIGNSVKW
jgi:nitric oxide reductase NorQ protein